MKVRELKAALADAEDEAEVCFDDDEAEYCDITGVEIEADGTVVLTSDEDESDEL